jgi:hypothetical protein
MVWKEQMGENNTYWQPAKVGEEVSGRVEEVRAEGKYGLQVVLKDEKFGKLTCTPSHKVLQARLVKVVKGDMIKIIYDGEQPPRVRGENPIKMYRVFVQEVEEESV